MPRRLAITAIVAVTVFFGLTLWQVFYLPGNPRINGDNLHRVHLGMTRAEVEAILGPPGDYSTGPIDVGWYPRPTHRGVSPSGNQLFWLVDDNDMRAEFNADGKLIRIGLASAVLINSRPFDWLKWRLARGWTGRRP
jgi:hypothetical protein